MLMYAGGRHAMRLGGRQTMIAIKNQAEDDENHILRENADAIVSAKIPRSGPPDDEGYEALRVRGYTADLELPNLSHLTNLRNRLLRLGGWAVILHFEEPDLDDILERGVLVRGKTARMRKGRPRDCHCNAARNARAGSDGIAIMTGYALSEDGAWRQHSWNLDRTSNRIIETTVKRVAYYGFQMDDDQAARFIANAF